MERAYAFWRAFQDRLLAPVAAFLLIGCTLLALLEVVRRYVFGVSFEWQADTVTFFILSAVYLYFGISQRHDEHLSVTLVPELLNTGGERAQRLADAIRTLGQAIAFVFLLAVVWWGIPEVVESIHYEVRTESLALPMWPFLLILLIGFAFMAVSTFFQIYRGIQKLRGKNVLEEPS
jgi:TRAP-type C4-dicarboxylate transport system permease small subunit